MALDTAMELSFWKEEPLSPVFTGLEDQTDVWELFKDDLAKHSPDRESSDESGSHVDWLPDSPSDSCDSIDDLQTRAQLASQLLQDLDDVLVKHEPFADPWYETKTDLPMFEELPSPTPALSKEDVLAGAAPRPFLPTAYTTSTMHVGSVAYSTPAPPLAVLVSGPVAGVHQPASESLHQLHERAVVAPPTAAMIPTGVHVLGPQQALPAVADTQLLLQEFECVFGKVEQSHGGALTPPQSPPHALHQLAADGYQPLVCLPATPLQALLPQDELDLLPTTAQQQQQLIAEVDELVRSRAQQAEESSWASPAAALDASLLSLAPPSPCTSSNSSFSSDSPAPASPEPDDPEWLPGSPASPGAEPEAGKRAKPAGCRKRGAGKRGGAGKPYANAQEDKRLRKKEQNKNAATRYRMKKKAEVEVILGEESELQRKNEELQAKVTDLSQEIRYLKNLMRDVFRAKGLLK